MGRFGEPLDTMVVNMYAKAKEEFQKQYLYYRDGDLLITSKYLGENWIGYSYPGGRTVVDPERFTKQIAKVNENSR